jgi:D-amino-acid oxidase
MLWVTKSAVLRSACSVYHVPVKTLERVIVLGCGVSGLSCAERLLRRGFPVTVIAANLPPNTTSDVAAAVWFPYKAYPEARVVTWGKTTYDELCLLADDPSSGVAMLTLIELLSERAGDPWWKTAVPDVRHARADELPDGCGYMDAYVVRVPRIEMPVYLPYLMSRVRSLGGQIQQRQVGSIPELHAEGSLVVNCTGLGARELIGDVQVYPIRGQILRVANPGLQCSWADESGPLALSYIVPRSNDCVLGGTAQEGDWNLEPDMLTAERILANCRRIEPRLQDDRVLEHHVGLRPGRAEVRLEIVRTSVHTGVIHNYGHGGAGVTLSWGCADEVTALASEFFGST